MNPIFINYSDEEVRKSNQESSLDLKCKEKVRRIMEYRAPVFQRIMEFRRIMEYRAPVAPAGPTLRALK